MPVHPVKGQPGCYQWGDSGKVYCGKDAKEKAVAQGRAIYASGYKGKAEMEMVSSDYQEGDGRWWLFHKWVTKKDDLNTIYTYDKQNDYQMWVLINPYKMGGIMTFICTTNNGDARQKCLNWIRSNTPKIKGKYQYEQRNKIEKSANNGNYSSIEFKELSYKENKFARSRIESFSRMRAEDNQKKHQTIDDANIGDVFRFGDGWELFVLKSKEIDGYDYPAVIYKIVFDPYVSSPVSDIEGLIRNDEKIRLWNNPRLEIFKKRRSLKKEAESSSKPHSVTISRSSNPEKKLMAVFEDSEGKKMKTTHFGQRGASDYTKHGDKERMERYLERHGGGTTTSTKEDWKDPTTAGALSRWILWNKPSLSASFSDYKSRFGLKGTLNVSKSAEERKCKSCGKPATNVVQEGSFCFSCLPINLGAETFEAKSPAQKSLNKWTKEDWGTKSGKPSTQGEEATGERYLPRKAREALTDKEYARTSAKKRRDTAKGKQFSDQPSDVEEKVAKYRSETFEANDMIKERYFEKQLKKYKNKLNWKGLSYNPALTPALIEKYEDKLDWIYLSHNPALTPALIEKYEDELNWFNLSQNPSLTPALIEKYENKLNWSVLSKNPSLTPALIEKYIDRLDWNYLSENYSLTPALIEKYKDKLYWRRLSRNPSLTPALIEKHEDKLNWNVLSYNPSLTPAFIEKYKDKLVWDYLSQNPSLTPALIEKYEDKLNWAGLSMNPSLTPALIEKYEDKLNWNRLSLNPSLTPALIEKYKDELNWIYLSQTPSLFGNLHIQKNAETFEANDMIKERYFEKQLKKYENELDWWGLSRNPSLTPALIEKYKDKLNWGYLSMNPSLTPAFIEKYKDKLKWGRLSQNPALTPALIEKYENKLDGSHLSLNPSLTPAFIEKYENKLHWSVLSQNPSLTPALIEKYENKLNWGNLSFNPSLTPALIEKYENKLNWSNLSQNPSLTPALIEKYENKLNWDMLSYNPSLTPAFIEKYEDKLRWSKLSYNPALTPALIEKYEDKLDWIYLSMNPSLTPALIKKYENKLKWVNLSENPALFGNLHIQKKAETFEAIEGNGSNARFTDTPDSKTYRDTGLRQKARNSLLKGTKGGDAGEWSARKAQMAATKYRTMYEKKYGEGKNPYF